MKFKINWIEYHSYDNIPVDAIEVNNSEPDWYECIMQVEFEAKSIKEAKKIAPEIQEGDSGVFVVWQDNKIVFTEEDI